MPLATRPVRSREKPATERRQDRGELVATPQIAQADATNPTAHRDIIVIGGSAGGLQSLERLLPDLPGDLPAAVFIVVHVGATSRLAEILDRAGSLPVVRAMSGQPIEMGRVYIAIPGFHLLLHDRHILLRRGPRENLARPAIDPLFRSAACTFGARTIGVVLSGDLNDGTAGLDAIKRCGGVAIVQDPADAAFPEMPWNALRHVDIDHVAPAGALAPLLIRLTREEPGATLPIAPEIRLETAIAAQELSGMDVEQSLRQPSRFNCPECQGALWEIDESSLLYRRHVGHAYTAERALGAQTRHGQNLLSKLLHTHQEHAALARRMAQIESARCREVTAAALRQRAAEADEDAAIIRGLLRDYAAPEAAELGAEAS
jgi:two-component system chemotaxis response regulator CheB